MATIRTFARVKPAKKQHDDYDTTPQTLYLRVPEHLREKRYGLNTKGQATVNHEFRFNHVFADTVPQDTVFDKVAQDIVNGFLEGYNGTIFAYGQTGSGKTYTMEGSARRYEDRGMAPRALSLIYKCLESRQEKEDVSIHVSYMEIYQEIGYDLLNMAARTSSVVTPFPKVTVVEGPRSSCVVRNLSTHLAATEDVAQSLLLQGQANRKVAETPMNQRSSRSHAVFTIQLAAKKHGADVITKSKLHLVDLAGSERVAKTGVEGQQLSEAKFINLSLHHLESVIVALQKESGHNQAYTPAPSNQTRCRPGSAAAGSNSTGDRSLSQFRPKSAPARRIGSAGPMRCRTPDSDQWFNGRPHSAMGVMVASPPANIHIPYRNSLLTMMLRDSLGGNCQTAMIATLNLEETNLNETISTCRFAQRVACITNTLRKNEEIDDKSMIRRLRKRIAELETEVALLKAGQGLPTGEIIMEGKLLTDEDKVACARLMQGYIGGKIRDPIAAGISHPLKFKECLQILKNMILEHYTRQDGVLQPKSSTSTKNGGQSRKAIVNSGYTALDVSNGNVETVTSLSLESLPSALSKFEATPPPEKKQNKQAWTEISTSSSQNALHRSRSVSPRAVHRVASTEEEVEVSLAALNGTQGQSRIGSAKSRSSAVSRSSSMSSFARRNVVKEEEKVVKKDYKSPYERKKEAEIKRLDKKIEKSKESIKSEEAALKDKQLQLREQQLAVIQEEISIKLEAHSAQLADQHAFVLKLRHNKADADLVEQERAVEKQLRRGKVKMEKRLSLIEEQLATIHKQQDKASGGRSARDVKDRASGIENKFPQYVKDGKMNTKQVLDLLQVQDKEQEKSAAKLEKQRLLVLSEELEIKEAATRQKLNMLKEKLRNSKSVASFGSLLNDSGSDLDLSLDQASSVPHHLHPSTSSVYSYGSSASPQPNHAHQDRLFQSPTPSSIVPESVQSTNSITFPMKWTNTSTASSRPSTTELLEQLKTQKLENAKKAQPKMFEEGYAVKQQRESSPAAWTDSLNNNAFGGTFNPTSFDTSPIKEAGYEDFDFLPGNNNIVEEERYSDILEESSGEESDQEPVETRISTPSSPRGPISINSSPNGTENFTDFEKSQFASRPRSSTVESDATNERSSSFESYLPSEYINQNSEKRFDGRKMGLGKSTFDSALDAMLENSGPVPRGGKKITYQQNQYDKFARQVTGGSAKSGRRSRSKGRAKDGKKPKEKKVDDILGPDSKNMSISDKLAKYLDMDSFASHPKALQKGRSTDDGESRKYQPRPHAATNGRSQGESKKKQTPNKHRPSMEIEAFREKIKAVNEDEAEETYMRSAREQKQRVSRIRRARAAAETIQGAWRRYLRRTGRQQVSQM